MRLRSSKEEKQADNEPDLHMGVSMPVCVAALPIRHPGEWDPTDIDPSFYLRSVKSR